MCLAILPVDSQSVSSLKFLREETKSEKYGRCWRTFHFRCVNNSSARLDVRGLAPSCKSLIHFRNSLGRFLLMAVFLKSFTVSVGVKGFVRFKENRTIEFRYLRARWPWFCGQKVQFLIFW